MNLNILNVFLRFSKGIESQTQFFFVISNIDNIGSNIHSLKYIRSTTMGCNIYG